MHSFRRMYISRPGEKKNNGTLDIESFEYLLVVHHNGTEPGRLKSREIGLVLRGCEHFTLFQWFMALSYTTIK